MLYSIHQFNKVSNKVSDTQWCSEKVKRTQTVKTCQTGTEMRRCRIKFAHLSPPGFHHVCFSCQTLPRPRLRIYSMSLWGTHRERWHLGCRWNDCWQLYKRRGGADPVWVEAHLLYTHSIRAVEQTVSPTASHVFITARGFLWASIYGQIFFNEATSGVTVGLMCSAAPWSIGLTAELLRS